MAKYHLKTGYRLSLTLIERDDQGKATFEKRIEFSGGNNVPHFTPGVYFTESKTEERILDAHPWNITNGGRDFEKSEPAPMKQRELDKKRKEAKKESRSNKATTKPTAEEDTGNTVENVTTAQEAINHILKEFPGQYTVRDLKPKSKLFEVADSLKLSFPNLPR